ncbi:MAG: hypothetical protein ACQETD_09865 [Pseudomonadota bacterium]
MHDTPKRLALRATLKLMALIALLTTGYILIAAIGSDEPERRGPAPLRIPLEQQAQTLQRIPWEGGNLLLLRRDAQTLKQLQTLSEHLLNPLSQRAKEPGGLSPSTRSRQPEWFLAYDRGPGTGCPLRWVPAGTTTAPIQPWPGGLRDACRPTWYDAAGRVLRGADAVRNLDIPPYHQPAADLLKVGENGDNPTSVD